MANKGKESAGSDLLWFVKTIAITVGAVLLVRVFVAEPYIVPTGSMLETIQEGDYLVGEKVSLHFEDPKQGDVVTFSSPEDGTTLIKRVIAVGGQTIDLRDGSVYIDDELLDEPYTLGKPTESLTDLVGSAGIEYPYTVPEGYVFLMGDNRTNSKDSRYFGAVSLSNVTSKALFIFWPLSDMGSL